MFAMKFGLILSLQRNICILAAHSNWVEPMPMWNERYTSCPLMFLVFLNRTGRDLVGQEVQSLAIAGNHTTCFLLYPNFLL